MAEKEKEKAIKKVYIGTGKGLFCNEVDEISVKVFIYDDLPRVIMEVSKAINDPTIRFIMAEFPLSEQTYGLLRDNSALISDMEIYDNGREKYIAVEMNKSKHEGCKNKWKVLDACMESIRRPCAILPTQRHKDDAIITTTVNMIVVEPGADYNFEEYYKKTKPTTK